MKLILNLSDDKDADEIKALIAGSRSALGKSKIEVAEIKDTHHRGDIEFVFGMMTVPVERIERLDIERENEGGGLTTFFILTTPTEHAILHYLKEKHTKKPPF